MQSTNRIHQKVMAKMVKEGRAQLAPSGHYRMTQAAIEQARRQLQALGTRTRPGRTP